MTKPRRSVGPAVKYRTCDACNSTLYFTDLETHFADHCPPSLSNWTQAFVKDLCLYSYAKLYTKGRYETFIIVVGTPITKIWVFFFSYFEFPHLQMTNTWWAMTTWSYPLLRFSCAALCSANRSL